MSVDKMPSEVPSLTIAQMIEIDRIMVEDLGITLVQMMESAGRNLARLAAVHLSGGGWTEQSSAALADPMFGNIPDRSVIALAGSGGNGGGVLVAARRLVGWGIRVDVVLGKEADRLDVVPARQLDSLVRMGVAVHAAAQIGRVGTANLVLDGLIGYSLKGAPRGATADLIHWANEQASPVLALDVPSGVDAGTGTVSEPAIRATATLTLALAKRGLLAPAVGAQVGRLFVGDIGVPAAVYERFGIDSATVARLFASKDVIALD